MGAERPVEALEVPDYVVGERLGAGGFGEVFRARHVVIGRDVAIKVLHAKYSGDAAAVARFVAEARAVNQVSHPGIVQIFDFGTLPDGRQFCVMELLAGDTLRGVLREHGRLPLADALPILRGIAAAVDAAHAGGIAHRDLKPDNVFVLPDGAIKLIDFGLAKLSSDAPAVTETGAVFGTPLYMSPEQCRGKNVDTRTDLYAFGCLAYHVLTGAPPFTGEPLEIALAHLNERPAPPSNRVPDLPARADAAVLALLAKTPADRPATLTEAVEAIAGERALRLRRRVRRWALAALGVAAAGGALAWRALRPAAVVDARPDICRPAAEMLEGDWDPLRRAIVAGKFAGAPLPAQDAWHEVSAALDKMSATWSDRWEAACASDERTRDPLLFAQRLSCLDRHLYYMQAQADVLANVPPIPYAASFRGADLYPIEECDDVAYLRGEPAEVAPEHRQEAAELLRAVAREEWEATYSNIRDVRAIDPYWKASEQGAQRLEALGSPLAAIAWTFHASTGWNSGIVRPANEIRGALRHAIEVGNAHRFDEQSAYAGSLLAQYELLDGDSTAARTALSEAEATSARTHPTALLTMQLRDFEGILAGRLGDEARALDLLAHPFVDVLASVRLTSDSQRIEYMLTAGRTADAVALGRDLVATAERTIGRHHPALQTVRPYFADALEASGDTRAADAQLRAVIEDASALGQSQNVIVYEVQRAENALGAGDEHTADEAIARARVELGGPSDAQLATTLLFMSGMRSSQRLYRAAYDDYPRLSPEARRDLDDAAAYAAYQLGDYQAMADRAARVGEVEIGERWWQAPYCRAVAAALAGKGSEVDAMLAALAPVERAEQGGFRSSAFDYKAQILARLGRYPEALVAAQRANAEQVANGSGFNDDRAEVVAVLGSLLVANGRLDEARPHLEYYLQNLVNIARFDYTTPFACFALARALWPEPARRERARRLATMARDGFIRVGPHRDRERRIVEACLAAPGSPAPYLVP